MSEDKKIISKQLEQLGVFLDEEVLEHISDLSFTNSYEYSNPREYHEFIDGSFELSYKYKEDKILFTGKYESNQTYENRYEPHIEQEYCLQINDKLVMDSEHFEEFNDLVNKNSSMKIVNELVNGFDSVATGIMEIDFKEQEIGKFIVIYHDSYSGPTELEYYKASSISKIYRNLINSEDIQGFLYMIVENKARYANIDYMDLEKVQEGENGLQYLNLSEKEIKKAHDNSEEIKDKLCDKSIKNIFLYHNTTGEGIQHGSPGKEWTGISIFEYEEPNFNKLS